MSFVQGNDLVEQFAAAASYPTLRDSILPGTLDGRLHAGDAHGSNRRRNVQSIFCVVVKDEELGRELIGEGFAQLLNDPTAGRMPSDIKVQDATTVVANDKEAVEHAERKRWNGEEIHRRDGFAVITQKRQPTFGRLWMPGCSPHPAGYGCLRYIEAEHEKFTVNARCAPGWILRHHSENQVANLFGDSLATADRFSHSAEHLPIKFEPGLVPPDHRFRQYEKERLFPIGPEAAGHDPEEFVECSQSWPRTLSLQDCQLLAEREVF